MEADRDVANTVLACFTGLLVVVGLCQILFLWRTVKATQDNASAAKLSAEGLINSERAWMAGFSERKQQFATASSENIGYICYVKNTGKTPSRILEIGIAFRKTDSLGNIPQEPAYREEEKTSFNTIVVPPDDSIPISANLSPPFTGDDYVSFRDRRLFIYGYGFVRYLDVFDKQRESLILSLLFHFCPRRISRRGGLGLVFKHRPNITRQLSSRIRNRGRKFNGSFCYQPSEH